VGLMGMRERAEHLRGTLSLESAPGRGTTVRVRVPLKRSPAPTPAEKVTQS
jgi:signal transduction histidine kinase